MDRRAFLTASALLAAPTAVLAQTAGLPSDDDVRRLLVQRVDQERQATGMVIGLIDAKGPRVFGRGVTKAGGAPVGADSLYEIGSITKTFTGLILTDMVLRGEVRVDQPVAELLPASAKVPSRGGKQITLIDLSTHTSGLPRMPNNFAPKDQANPYADYTVEQLYAFLNGYALPRDIGERFEYSNLGVGLLGHALSLKAGKPYETLVRERVLGPLRMPDTTIGLSAAQQSRLAIGHNFGLEPVANWDLPTLAGAGALRSTATDLLKLLSAHLGYAANPLQAAMTAQLQPRRPADGESEICLGWAHFGDASVDIFSHGGGTGGYSTYAGFDPRRRIGAVVLVNTGSSESIGDTTGFLMRGAPLRAFKPPPVELALDQAKAASWAGVYRMPNDQMTVTHEAGRLYAQIVGQPRLEVFQSGPAEVFWKAVQARGDFESGPDGRVAAFVLHQNGQDLRWNRAPPAIPLDLAKAAAWAGTYEEGRRRMIVTLEQGRLYAQTTGAQRNEVFQYAPNAIFWNRVDSTAEFVTDATGKVTGILSHRGGQEFRWRRVE